MFALIKEISQRTVFLDMIGEDHIFPIAEAAVRLIEMSVGSNKPNQDG